MTYTLVTHSGSFHADDVTAYAILSCVFPDAQLIRTRDQNVINQGNIVFDVGHIYNEINRFDHHQAGGPQRPNGQLYSSAGLIWKHYGCSMIASVVGREIENNTVKNIWRVIDQGFITGIDLVDNGVGSPGADNISVLVGQFNPTWEEQMQSINPEDILLSQFLRASEIIRQMIIRMIMREMGRISAEKTVMQCVRQSNDSRIIELPTGMPWQEIVYRNKLTTLYVLHPNIEKNAVMINCVSVEPNSFANRKSLPQSWSAKHGDELARLTGVPDAVFCHRNCFVASARSWEGARKLVFLALEN
jgi:uncharacterized UPF0160 family protein